MRKLHALPTSIRFVLCLITSGLGIGCSNSISTTYLNDGIQPGKPVFYGNVLIFASRQLDRPFEELGSVCVSIHAEVTGDTFVTRLQKEAARIGADAIVAYEQIGNAAIGIAIRFTGPRTGTQAGGSGGK